LCLNRKSAPLHDKIQIFWFYNSKNRKFGAFLLVRRWVVRLKSENNPRGGIIVNLGNTCKVAWLLPIVIVQSRDCGVKKYPLHFARLVLLFVSAVVLFAQTDHTTAFTGTWKLNGAKSTFNPGPAPKSVTVTNAPDGTFKAQSVDAQGKAIKWSHAWSGGAEVPIDGIENATILSKVRGHTLDETMKIGGKTAETVHAVVSPNGRTMTTTIDATTDHQGGPMHNVLTLEKQ
jgi:hypothetical protein